MWLADWALRYEIDRARHEVGASIAGGHASRSVYRAGRGCTLAFPGRPPPEPLVTLPHAPMLLAPIAGPAPVYPRDTRLRNAIDAAFAEPAIGARRATKAVVIVHEDRLIAERYAPGYRLDTPLLSHSVAKSVVNSLVGILARQGKLRLSEPAPVAAWHGERDPRGAITIDHLLRMNAGFGFDEGVFPSPATRAWYTDPDTAHVAEQAALRSPVGRSWAYSSLSYAVLSRIIGDTVGGGPQGLRDFAQRERFDPLGMATVTLEFDASGTMMGAQAMFATARDWARFGLLYLHDGLGPAPASCRRAGWTTRLSPRSRPAMAPASGSIGPRRRSPNGAYPGAYRMPQATPLWRAAISVSTWSSCPRKAWSWSGSGCRTAAVPMSTASAAWCTTSSTPLLTPREGGMGHRPPAPPNPCRPP
jgi:CubicO group peptidase (beta-lactamase class C family)